MTYSVKIISYTFKQNMKMLCISLYQYIGYIKIFSIVNKFIDKIIMWIKKLKLYSYVVLEPKQAIKVRNHKVAWKLHAW